MSTETIWVLSAEIVLIATAVAIYLAGALVEGRSRCGWIAAGGLLVSALALWQWGQGELPVASPTPASQAAANTATPAAPTASALAEGDATFGGSLAVDRLGYFGRWLALAMGGLLLLLAARPLEKPGTAEYVGSLLLAVAGLMLVCGAGNLVLLVVGLELISIPTYILLALGRRDAAGREAAVKYFFLSILASAMLVYGLSFLYGTAGSTQLPAIRAALAQMGGAAAGMAPLGKVAFVLILAGLGFKITAVPFHFYAPDVYQGTTYPNGAFLSVLPKAAGMIALVRVVVVAMPTPPDVRPYAWFAVLVLSMLTMTVGNVMALWQDNLRRLLAYSSVAHAGTMLAALAVGLVPVAARGKYDGIGALLFYLCVYAVATIGTFAALEFLGRREHPIEAVDELAGLGRTRPWLAVAVAVFMFSLAGVPPLAGFWGKWFVFLSALGVDAGNTSAGTLWPWFVGLAVVGMLNAAVAAAYYLRVVAVMYFRTPLATPRPQAGTGAWLTLTLCAVLTVLIGVLPGPLLRLANGAKPAATAEVAAHRPSTGAGTVAEDSAASASDVSR